LKTVVRLNRTVGSNPTLSAKFSSRKIWQNLSPLERLAPAVSPPEK
jgi:hypothetical protein